MSRETRAWVRLPSGKRLDLLHPTPFDWDDGDLAVGLARTYRWGGHSAWPLPLSVAQHSLMVLAMHRRAARSPGIAAELRELLHDADEGLLGFDCISVVKPFLGEAFRALTVDLQRAVAIRPAAPPPRPTPSHPRPAPPRQGVPGGTPWEPWAPTLAAERFLVELRALCAREVGALESAGRL